MISTKRNGDIESPCRSAPVAGKRPANSPFIEIEKRVKVIYSIVLQISHSIKPKARRTACKKFNLPSQMHSVCLLLTCIVVGLSETSNHALVHALEVYCSRYDALGQKSIACQLWRVDGL